MSLKNLINVSFTEEEVTALMGHLTGVDQILEGKTVNLTAEERTKYGILFGGSILLANAAACRLTLWVSLIDCNMR